MHIDELRDLFGLSRAAIHKYVSRGLIPPPHGYGRWARYGRDHVEAIHAWLSLRHVTTSSTELGPFLREEGITLVEYVRRRESAIRAHGLGVA